ncbi:MAG: peptide chain release factor N(5)-glutamine methyltransferase [Oxalobacteraceae bacterium]|jgi:release factor glutamine methyltransferase|nr:peptide chain release factor N(5)-glutamine methyltransferase [Oxalobacteraceae bacterium]
MNVEDLLKAAPVSPLEARILIAHSLQWSRVQLITQSKNSLTPKQVEEIQCLLERRLQGEPIAYLTGHREFYGLMFAVTPDVLIPRPETELLVELALERMSSTARVLDMGTGSGAVAVAVAHQRPDAHVVATDVSAKALEVARKNALSNQVQIDFLLSNWYEVINKKFDLIVSNPPYIAAGDVHLTQGDLRFEPAEALTDQATGLTAIEKIIRGAPAHLEVGGWLLLEHGYDQASAVRELFASSNWSDVQSWCDLAGIQRVSGARLH